MTLRSLLVTLCARLSYYPFIHSMKLNFINYLWRLLLIIAILNKNLLIITRCRSLINRYVSSFSIVNLHIFLFSYTFYNFLHNLCGLALTQKSFWLKRFCQYFHIFQALIWNFGSFIPHTMQLPRNLLTYSNSLL